MICGFCGTDFTPKRPHGRYCGTDCRRRAQNWRRRVARAEELAEGLAELQEKAAPGSAESAGSAGNMGISGNTGSSGSSGGQSAPGQSAWLAGRAGACAGAASPRHAGRAGASAGASSPRLAGRALTRERRRCRREELDELGAPFVYHAGKSLENGELPEPGDLRISAEAAWQAQLSAPWARADFLTPDGRLFWLITQGDVPDLPLSDLEHWTPEQMLETSALGEFF